MKIRLRVKETIVYDQEVEVSEDEYAILMEHDGDDVQQNENGYDTIDYLIDRRNVLDNTGLFEDFEIEKI